MVSRIVLSFLLSGLIACKAETPDPPAADVQESEQSEIWPIPPGWKSETFPLPPGFAPGFPYQGSEDLRFMPGWSSPEAPDFWSYDLIWWLDEPPPFDTASMAAVLVTYFRGLCIAVGGEKYEMDSAYFRADLIAAPDSNPPRLTGQVFIYDAFKTGQPIILNVEAELRSCPQSKKVAVVAAFSPKPTTDSVWTALRTTAGTLICD